jgi:hypothetical protein
MKSVYKTTAYIALIETLLLLGAYQFRELGKAIQNAAARYQGAPFARNHEPNIKNP